MPAQRRDGADGAMYQRAGDGAHQYGAAGAFWSCNRSVERRYWGYVEFRVLGPVEVWEQGQRLAVGGSKPRAVLAVLLLDAGRVVSIERLIDELWDGDQPRGARNTV